MLDYAELIAELGREVAINVTVEARARGVQFIHAEALEGGVVAVEVVPLAYPDHVELG